MKAWRLWNLRRYMDALDLPLFLFLYLRFHFVSISFISFHLLLSSSRPPSSPLPTLLPFFYPLRQVQYQISPLIPPNKKKKSRCRWLEGSRLGLGSLDLGLFWRAFWDTRTCTSFFVLASLMINSHVWTWSQEKRQREKKEREMKRKKKNSGPCLSNLCDSP